MRKYPFYILLLATITCVDQASSQISPVSKWWHGIERKVHYLPSGEDFVCVNGRLRFNRALYGTNTGFRVETGDLPEFAMYMPGMGGNLKFGLIRGDSSKWIINAGKVKATYRPGSMLYEIRDPLLGSGTLQLTVLALPAAEGMILKATFINVPKGVTFLWAYGGATGKKFSRDGDIGADPESSFYLQPGYCTDNVYSITLNSFRLFYGSGKVLSEEERYEIHQNLSESPSPGNEKNVTRQLLGIVPPSSNITIGDAVKQGSPLALQLSKKSATPVVTGSINISSNNTLYFLVQNAEPSMPADYDVLPSTFEQANTARKVLAERIKVITPDPWINTLGGALSMAADAIWEDPSYLHGSVAWRMRLPAWRGPYAGDVLGWHDRARKHFSSYALSQVTAPLTGPVVADTALNLARQLEKMGTAMFSSGYISRNPGGDLRPHHYDMNLVFIDALLNHFYWTGDKEYVKKMWPLLQRHLAWEKRNFDADGDGLYDAYAAIWASDALQYSGGGVTHSSAYNYRANKIAAMLAVMIGEDPGPYRDEASKILRAMNASLWMPSNGWYAEYKDLLGLKGTHPSAGLWTIYHAIDSKVPDVFQAYQCLRYVDTQIPHIPVNATGLAEKGLYVLSTTNWQPYTWSLNNVALAENHHAALAYWQGGRSEEAFTIWKSSLVESMYLGASPGNFQQLSFYDAIRGELYRDFGDPVGLAARSLVEGLFGITPDALNDTLTIRPGWPMKWQHASLRTPDIVIDFRKNALQDSYRIIPSFPVSMHLKLEVQARMDAIEFVTVNGKRMAWKPVETSIGYPAITISCASAPQYEIAIKWKGSPFAKPASPLIVANYEKINLRFGKASGINVFDPQKAISITGLNANGMSAAATAGNGNKTFFVQLKQGRFMWWWPVSFKALKPVEIVAGVNQPANQLEFFVQNNTARQIIARIITNPGPASNTTVATISPGARTSLIQVSANHLISGSNAVKVDWDGSLSSEQTIINWNIKNGAFATFEKMDLAHWFNDKVTAIFKNKYLSPRPVYPTLQLPVQGIGNWCYPLVEANIDDSGLRRWAVDKNEIRLSQNIPFSTPGGADAKNILFTSLWDNYPDSVSIPLTGKASHIYLLMAGSTNAMQTNFDNGIVLINYKDGSSAQLMLRNPETWWPVEQDYYTDENAFSIHAARPIRILLKKGAASTGINECTAIKGFTNKAIDGGAATVLDMILDDSKELRSLQVRTLANDVVIGLMSATLVRPANPPGMTTISK